MKHILMSSSILTRLSKINLIQMTDVKGGLGKADLEIGLRQSFGSGVRQT